MADPHGYARLTRALSFLVRECREAGAAEVAEGLEAALAFSGLGSATEFLGEAELSLRHVVDDSESIPPSIRMFAAALRDEIREGFAHVGGG